MQIIISWKIWLKIEKKHVSATQVNTAISQLPCGRNAGKVTI